MVNQLLVAGGLEGTKLPLVTRKSWQRRCNLPGATRRILAGADLQDVALVLATVDPQEHAGAVEECAVTVDVGTTNRQVIRIDLGAQHNLTPHRGDSPGRLVELAKSHRFAVTAPLQ